VTSSRIVDRLTDSRLGLDRAWLLIASHLGCDGFNGPRAGHLSAQQVQGKPSPIKHTKRKALPGNRREGPSSNRPLRTYQLTGSRAVAVAALELCDADAWHVLADRQARALIRVD
jgi:hypothetical protein